ncbi:DUF881 domain-containing protein [Pseudomonadota bacterium]
MQAKSFTDFTDTIRRNDRADVFQELQILKTTNEDLQDEITDLEEQLEKTSTTGEALEGIKEEIERNKILAGRVDISGPGLEVTINNEIKAIWLIDIVNQLFTGGAEAVSINNIRLMDKTVGFDTIPSGQILLNGVIIELPYKINALGDKETLETVLTQPSGILERMALSLGEIDVVIEQKDLIQVEKVI